MKLGPAAPAGHGGTLPPSGGSRIAGKSDTSSPVRLTARLLPVVARYGTLIVLVGLLILFSILSLVELGEQRFLTGTNLTLILRQAAVLSILAGGVTVVLVMGEFDLSITGGLTLGGAIFALALEGSYVLTWPTIPGTDVGGGAILPDSLQASVGFAILLGIVFGIVVGLLNGFVVAHLRVSAFIGTLGMAGLIEGYLLRLGGGGVSIPVRSDVVDFARGSLFGWESGDHWEIGPLDLAGLTVPLIAVLAVGVLSALWVFLNLTEAGRRIDAVGGNAEAARLAGINVSRYRMLAFVITGATAAVAGLALAGGRSGFASTLAANQGSFLLQAYTACFLGAVTLREGEFHIVGTGVGALLMTTTTSGLIIIGVPGYGQILATGGILIVALAVSGVARRHQTL